MTEQRLLRSISKEIQRRRGAIEGPHQASSGPHLNRLPTRYATEWSSRPPLRSGMATPVWASNWDCRAVGAEDAEAYGSVPSFVLIAEMCFSIGGLNWRRLASPQISGWNDSDGEPLALVFAQEHGAGLEAWQTRTRRGTSTSLILVRIQAHLRRNSSDMSASYSPSITSRPTPLLPAGRG